MKYPYLKFYVRDWTGDQQLRMVSLSARGLWLECICIMHTAKRYGYLETPTGAPFEDETMSRLIGTSKDDLYRLKSELLTAGIPSVEDVTGIWFSRRMVKEKQKAEKCSEAGKKGGGNPSLASHPNTNTNDIQIPDTRNHISINVTFKGVLYTCVFEAFWTNYPKKVGKPQAEKALKKALRRASHEIILAGIEKHLPVWMQTEKQFIPHPATWLNRDGWADEVIETATKEEKKEREVWYQCLSRCNNWDEQKRWCKRHVKEEPRTVECCEYF